VERKGRYFRALETSLEYALNKTTAPRFHHRCERARFKDWHYHGLPLVFAEGAGRFLGAGPQNYTAHLIGILFQHTPGKQDKAAR
jgi:hypothetical protein